MEKDLGAAHITVSSDFLAVTNHDGAIESWEGDRYLHLLQEKRVEDTLLGDSEWRKECLVDMWSRRQGRGEHDGATLEQVQQWMKTYPVQNTFTHFSCIMDPSQPGGGILWVSTADRVIFEEVEGMEL